MNSTHKYPLDSRVEAMLKYFYDGDIELMMEKIRNKGIELQDVDHRGDEIIKYLKIKQRKDKLLKIKNRLL